MEAKENRRLKEIKLSVHINHIDKVKDKMMYNRLLKVLSCVALSINGESNKKLSELVQISVCDGFARATHKELYASLSTFFGKYEAINKLATNGTTFYRKFGDVMSMDYITKDYLDSLEPIFKDDISYDMVDILNKFIDGFKIYISLTNNMLNMKERTLELDFLFIYDKLMEIFNNAGYVDKLIYNICNAFSIDYSTIAHLKNHIHIINRSFPNLRYNERYLTQEIVTLYTYRGYKKGTIGSKILGKASNYLFVKNRKNIAEPIKPEDLSWQYTPTLDWKNLDKESVYRFIDVFQLFSEYNV